MDVARLFLSAVHNRKLHIAHLAPGDPPPADMTAGKLPLATQKGQRKDLGPRGILKMSRVFHLHASFGAKRQSKRESKEEKHQQRRWRRLGSADLEGLEILKDLKFQR